MKITLFVDGSAYLKSKPRCGGIGVFCPELNIQLFKGYTTSDISSPKMELNACIEGLKYIKNNHKNISNIQIYSDSLYVVKAMTIWYNNWNENNFVKVANVDLIKKLYKLSNMKKFTTMYTHVYSHKTEPINKLSNEWILWNGNFIADKLAKDAMIVELNILKKMKNKQLSTHIK